VSTIALMRSRILAILLLGALLPGAKCDQNVTEVDANGVPISWWLSVKVRSGYPMGEPKFIQTDHKGTPLEVTSTVATVGTSTYQGDEKSYSVRIKNRDSCAAPCGYFHAYLCPITQPDCDSVSSVHDFGVVTIADFNLSI
jgi:hypothetical protein